jgi:hypothetical protein
MRLELEWERLKILTRMLSGRHPQVSVNGLSFLDLRTDRFLDHDQPAEVLKEALGHVTAAKGGFGELVTSHLRQVVAVDLPAENVSAFARSYYTTFPARDRRSTFWLACKLVWAATFIRIMRNQPWWRRAAARKGARASAREAQLRFVRQFPDSQRWEDYISRHPD